MYRFIVSIPREKKKIILLTLEDTRGHFEQFLLTQRGEQKEKKEKKNYWPRVVETVFTTDKNTDRPWNARRKFAYLMGIKSIDDSSSIPLLPGIHIRSTGCRGREEDRRRAVTLATLDPVNGRATFAVKSLFPISSHRHRPSFPILTPISRLLYDRITYSNRLVPYIYIYSIVSSRRYLSNENDLSYINSRLLFFSIANISRHVVEENYFHFCLYRGIRRVHTDPRPLFNLSLDYSLARNRENSNVFFISRLIRPITICNYDRFSL